MRTLVTGALQATAEDLNKLKALGLDITLHRDERETVVNPEEYEAVICNGLFLYNDIEKFSSLKYIQLTSAGYDRVPMDYAKAHGITVKNADGVYAVPMAEWTLMRVLELYKNAEKLFSEKGWVKDRAWRELSGKTACIVGYGAYGREAAKRLKAFDVKVIAVNRSVKDCPCVDEFLPLDSLNEALGRADIVIMAIALTDETRHMMNKQRFSAMKDGAIFINAARGDLVDEAALLEALGSRLSGAALDVFSAEPLPEDSPLRSADRLFISPHNSFVGENNRKRLVDVISVNIRTASTAFLTKKT